MESIKVTATEFKELANINRKVVDDKTILHTIISYGLEGAPGMGKTSVVRSLATDWKLPFITVAINQWVNGSDIVGFSYKGHKNKDGSFDLAGEDEIPNWLPFYRIDPATDAKVPTTDETKGYRIWTDPKTGLPEAHAAVVLLDEFSAANPRVQGTFLTVALTKIVKVFHLHNDVNFFIAFNGCDREGFMGQTSEISPAMLGSCGRYFPLELIYEDASVLRAVQENTNISMFWKMFSKKHLKDLKLSDEALGHHSCGRTYENLMLALSFACYDNKHFDRLAKKIVEIHFFDSDGLAKLFISLVENFDVPSGEEYLNGTAIPKNFSEALIGINAISTTLGFRSRCNENVISSAELSALEQYMDKQYPTGTKHADGSPIMGSKKEMFMVLKTSLIREKLESKAEFRWVATKLDGMEKKTSTKSKIDEEPEF